MRNFHTIFPIFRSILEKNAVKKGIVTLKKEPFVNIILTNGIVLEIFAIKTGKLELN